MKDAKNLLHDVVDKTDQRMGAQHFFLKAVTEFALNPSAQNYRHLEASALRYQKVTNEVLDLYEEYQLYRD